MEWNSILTKEFIEDYRDSPELWNHNISDYKDAEKRSVRLKQLAAKYGCAVCEVKAKIKNLRSAYHRERKNSVLRGRKVKWFAYKALNFLKEVDSTVEPTPTPVEMIVANPEYEIKIEGEDDQESSSVDTPSHNALTTEFNSSDMVNKPAELLFYSASEVNKPTDLLYSSNSEVNKPEVASNKRAKRRKEPTLLDFDEDTSTYHHHNRNTSSLYQHNRNSEQMRSGVGRDEFSTYGEYVANELRHLSYRSQVMAKHVINNTLFEAAMGKYEIDDGAVSACHDATLQDCTATVLTGSI